MEDEGIKKIRELVEFEYEFASEDRHLIETLSFSDMTSKFIEAAKVHLEEVCQSFETRHYTRKTGLMFYNAEAEVHLKDYSIARSGYSLDFEFELEYIIHGFIDDDERDDFVSDLHEAYDNIYNVYRLYCMSSEVTRHFNIINESDIDEIEVIVNDFSRSVIFDY